MANGQEVKKALVTNQKDTCMWIVYTVKIHNIHFITTLHRL